MTALSAACSRVDLRFCVAYTFCTSAPDDEFAACVEYGFVVCRGKFVCVGGVSESYVCLSVVIKQDQQVKGADVSVSQNVTHHFSHFASAQNAVSGTMASEPHGVPDDVFDREVFSSFPTLSARRHDSRRTGFGSTKPNRPNSGVIPFLTILTKHCSVSLFFFHRLGLAPNPNPKSILPSLLPGLVLDSQPWQSHDRAPHHITLNNNNIHNYTSYFELSSVSTPSTPKL
ncbi:hypothetical protein Sjap_013549 [Stephania japonica]|uniref:Uncharacterized protein n=1 Tax=Stephania japonica TaxID=461633 RepID=A0AAP0J039_9MAGN